MDNSILQLDNPVWSALTTGNKELGSGNDIAKYFRPSISPFAAVADFTPDHFRELAREVAGERTVLIFTVNEQLSTPGWKHVVRVDGLQMMYKGEIPPASPTDSLVLLTAKDIPAMLALTKLTEPGPFLEETIEFGGYEGIFVAGRLAAMTGRRMHCGSFVEISAVCTHPDFTGRGYARQLINSQIRQLDAEGLKSFLHVREDNERAIGVYEKMGFEVRTKMKIYVLAKETY